MNSLSFSYPHPVLGLGDDVLGEFIVDIEVKRNPQKRSIEFLIKRMEVNNSYISGLLASSKAGLIFKIYCSSSFKTWTFLNPDEGFEIPEDDLVNKVDIEPLIVALETLYNYNDSSFNEEFEGTDFLVNKYDVIGVLGKIQVPVDKIYEKLGLGNIFVFSPEEDHTKPVYFDFNSKDKIYIKYPVTPDGVHPHNALFSKNPWTAYNIFIVPALTEAFRLMKDPEERSGIEDKEWYYALEQAMPEDERDDDPFKTAQLLLNKEVPLLKAYYELCEKN